MSTEPGAGQSLGGIDSKEARALLVEFVSKGGNDGIYPLYSNLKFHSDTLKPDELLITSPFVKTLIRRLRSRDGQSALELAQILIQKSPRVRDLLQNIEPKTSSMRLLLQIILAGSKLSELISTAITEISGLENYCLEI